MEKKEKGLIAAAASFVLQRKALAEAGKPRLRLVTHQGRKPKSAG